MFENKFLDFSITRASDRRLPDGFPNNPDTNPYQCHNQSRDGLDLCKKLNKMGISCDMSIWSKPEDFGSKEAPRHRFDQNLAPRNVSSAHGLGLRFLGSQDTFNPTNVFEEIMAFKNHRDLLQDHMNRPIKRSLMFEGDRALAAMEGSYAADSLRARGVSLWKDALQKGSMFEEGKRVSRALFTREVQDYSLKNCNNLAAMEGSSPKKSTSLSWNLASMVNIYGSVKLMAKDHVSYCGP